MDKISDSDSEDTGSIPVGATKDKGFSLILFYLILFNKAIITSIVE